MCSKIVGWLVGAWDGKILGFKNNPEKERKKSRINQEMVNTKFLPFLNYLKIGPATWANF